MDVLSDVLRAVRLTGAVYFDIDASSPWVGASPDTARIAASVMPGVEHVVYFFTPVSRDPAGLRWMTARRRRRSTWTPETSSFFQAVRPT